MYADLQLENGKWCVRNFSQLTAHRLSQILPHQIYNSERADNCLNFRQLSARVDLFCRGKYDQILVDVSA